MLRSGDFKGAERASEEALRYSGASIKIGFLLILISVILLISLALFGFLYLIDLIHLGHYTRF